MGQQPPYQPYQPFMPPGNPGYPGYTPPGYATNGATPPALNDPRIQQMIQQSLANPNGDTADLSPEAEGAEKAPFGTYDWMVENEMLPKPLHMLYGALGGVAASFGLEKLYANNAKKAIDIAQRIDHLPGIRQASQWLETNLVDKIGESIETMQDLAKKKYWSQATIRMLPEDAEKYMVSQVMDRLKPTIPKVAYDELMKAKPQTAEATIKALEAAMKSSHVTEAETIQKAFQNLSGQKGYKEVAEKLLKTKNLKQAEKIISNKGFFRRLGMGRTPIEAPLRKELLNRLATAKTKAGAYHRMRGAYNRINGLKNHYFPIYKAQYQLRQTLKHGDKVVGPIGRFFASMGNNVRRLFSGNTLNLIPDALADAGKKAASGSLLGKIFAPALMGITIIGLSFTRGTKAEEGDKLATFSHDLLGFGLGNFLGWEVGRAFLNKFQVVPQIMGFLNRSHWAEKIAIQIPRVLTKIPLVGSKLAAVKWGITLVGFATEMLAMFGIGHYFQKAGEAVSHAIFGKPKSVIKEELEAEGLVQAMGSEPGKPLQRIGRFSELDMNLDQRPNTPSMPANTGFDLRGNDPVKQIPMPSFEEVAPDFDLSPAEIMASPAADSFKAYEDSIMGI